MRGSNVVLILLLLVASSLGMIGCKDGVPQSDLDQFILQMNDLDSAAQADSLRAIASAGMPRAAFATYMTGNNYYVAASDSARLHGWGSSQANTLLDSAEVYFNAAVALDSTFIEALVNLGSLWDDRSEQLSGRADRDQKVAKAESYYLLALEVAPLPRPNSRKFWITTRAVPWPITTWPSCLPRQKSTAKPSTSGNWL